MLNFKIICFCKFSFGNNFLLIQSERNKPILILLWDQVEPLHWPLEVPRPHFGEPHVLVCFCAVSTDAPPAGCLPHCSSSTYTPLSDSTALHSLEDGGLRSTIRWGTLVLCLQLPDRKLRKPGKILASLDTWDIGLSRPGCIFARRRPWLTLCPVDARLSPGLSAASRWYSANRYHGLCACVYVWMSTMSWRLAFTCFSEDMSSAMVTDLTNIFLCWCLKRSAAGVCLLGEDYLVCRGAPWKLLTHSWGKF